MRAFSCRVCAHPLFFDNLVCISCETKLAYARREHDIVPLRQDGIYVDADGWVWHPCLNRELFGCPWLTERPGEQCFSCSLTRTRPSDADLKGLAQFPLAEAAKRRLVVELDALGLPIVTRDDDPEHGLAFDLLSSVAENVVIGHENGVITLDLAEGDDAYRERVRAQLAEPYRTLLGHFRHEIGHYYEALLVDGNDGTRRRVRDLFGDETIDYQTSIDRHYADGPPAGWEERYISSYATMHPFEDFAETFAHVMHISDTVDTARAHGLSTVDPSAFTSFRDLVTGVWVPMSTALNQINRSMGAGDLYPFVIAPAVLDKLDLVAEIVRDAGRNGAGSTGTSAHSVTMDG
jgi:hypothetical protein